MQSVCVLITTFNRSDLLDNTLNRMTKLARPDEILVIDDGGNDGCENLCKDYEIDLPIRYIYNHQPEEAQCSLARNIGIKNTDCDWIVTSEPELLWDTDVLPQMFDAMRTHPDQAINAGTIYHQQENPHESRILTQNWVAPFCCMYKREWLLEIGGWDEGFPDPWGWDDTDLLTRLRYSGYGQFIDESIKCTHQWHPTRACRQDRNEDYFRAKVFPLDLVANKGEQWGVIRSR